MLVCISNNSHETVIAARISAYKRSYRKGKGVKGAKSRLNVPTKKNDEETIMAKQNARDEETKTLPEMSKRSLIRKHYLPNIRSI